MKHPSLLLALVSLLALPLAARAGTAGPSAALTSAQTQFLSGYENVRAALAADDLPTAQKAATTLAGQPAAAQLAHAKDLDSARVAFKALSATAVTLAKNHSGYYVAYCPMVDSDWVQTNRTISNPYLGKAMPDCGSIQP